VIQPTKGLLNQEATASSNRFQCRHPHSCNHFALLLSYNDLKPKLVAMQTIMDLDTFSQTRQ
jgi:hypothetical protein